MRTLILVAFISLTSTSAVSPFPARNRVGNAVAGPPVRAHRPRHSPPSAMPRSRPASIAARAATRSSSVCRRGCSIRSPSASLISLVQLGGLEPPTSCSTDRRSNQLSYNCILREGPLRKGVANGPETRCNASLWQGRGVTDYGRPEGVLHSFAKDSAAARRPGKSLTGSKKPGPIARAFLKGMPESGQAAGL